MSTTTLRSLLKSPPAYFWLAVLLAPLPLLALNLGWMWKLKHYQFFPFLLLGIGVLAWHRWDKQPAFPRDPWSLGMLALGQAAIVGGIWIWSPWLATIGWVLFVGAWMKSQNQSQTKWGLLHLWPPLWLLIRLPMHLDTQLMGWLQGVSSRLSSLVMDLIELPHRLQGNAFDLATGSLFIGEACSGVQSLFTMLFCSMFLVALFQRRVTLLPLYMLAGVVWAGILNVMRIVAIAVAQEWFHVDLLHGWKHDLLGYTCLTIAIGLLASTDRLIRVFAFPVPEPDPGVKFVLFENLWNRVIATRDDNLLPADAGIDAIIESERETESEPESPSPTDFGWGKALLVGAGCVLLIGYAMQVRPLLGEMRRIAKPTSAFWQLDEGVIADQIGNFSVSKYQHIRNSENLELGSNADVWDGTSGGMHVRLVVSQPYYEWHNLAECYGAEGWLLNQQRVIHVPVKGDGNPVWPCDASSWIRRRQHGVLVFSGLDRQGDPVSPPHTSVSALIGARLEQNRWRTGIFNEYMMIQLWATSSLEFTDQQRKDLQALHLQAREAVRKSFSESFQANSQ